MQHELQFSNQCAAALRTGFLRTSVPHTAHVKPMSLSVVEPVYLCEIAVQGPVPRIGTNLARRPEVGVASEIVERTIRVSVASGETGETT